MMMAHERPPTVECAARGPGVPAASRPVAAASGSADAARIHTGPIDARTFAELYPSLRRFAAAVSPAHVDPDDLVQEALARVLRRPSTVEPIAAPAAYLRQSVLNAERSLRRTAVRRRAIDPILAADEATTPIYPSDLALLDALDAGDRALLYLTAVERWTFAEVGALLDKPEASLRVRASRLRKTLRDQLALEREPDERPRSTEGDHRDG